MRTTGGHLLDGRVRYSQPEGGYRTGIEPVLLAATIAPRSGEQVLEAGAGAGAGMLCLGFRMARTGVAMAGVAVEREAGLAALAAANLRDNRLADIGVVVADVAQGAAMAAGRFHHAFANPPWHRADSTASPDCGRDRAKRASPGLEQVWATALAATLRHRGTLTLIVPAARLPAWIAAMSGASCGSLRLLPIWPRAGHAAKLVLLRGLRFGAGDCSVLPGLDLHEQGGGFTAEAEAVLREGKALSF